MQIVFLLEEASMSEVLNRILPRILPDGIDFICIAHNGKTSLKDSIPKKLRAWLAPDVRFVIVHDKDSNDCRTLKADLMALALEANRPDTLVRIICTELESWFLGDLDAVEMAYHLNLAKVKQKSKFRDPDRIANAKEELRKLIPSYQMISGSKSIAEYMNPHNNKSCSFSVFISGVQRLCDEGIIH